MDLRGTPAAESERFLAFIAANIAAHRAAELVATRDPEGTGLEPEAASEPAGRGTEPEAAAPPHDQACRQPGGAP